MTSYKEVSKCISDNPVILSETLNEKIISYIKRKINGSRTLTLKLIQSRFKRDKISIFYINKLMEQHRYYVKNEKVLAFSRRGIVKKELTNLSFMEWVRWFYYKTCYALYVMFK